MHTEDVSIRYAALDMWSEDDLFDALSESQMAATAAVYAVRDPMIKAVKEAVERLSGEAGRIIYCGAGASGRIGVQDGAELFPTFGWAKERLVFLFAGGEAALVNSVEGAEDDADEARAQIEALSLTKNDVLIAIAASGKTPYVIAAAEAAQAAGALVIGVMNNAGGPLAELSDHSLEMLTGAEVVAGSTRMAAGTAQKIALNILSTSIMVKLGRVYNNLMADLASDNVKLSKRRLQILRQIVPSDEKAAGEALQEAKDHIKTAALLLSGCTFSEAQTILKAHSGNLRQSLLAVSTSTT